VGGNRGEANEVLDEIFSDPRLLDPSLAWNAALMTVELGREAEYLAADPSFRESLWADAGRAACNGDLARAAEIYDDIGASLYAAWARLLAAERGDLGELGPARAFFAAVDARPFLALCDAVLAASA